jgi:hypothetical protein
MLSHPFTGTFPVSEITQSHVRPGCFLKDRPADPTLITEPVAGMNANIIMVNSTLITTQSDKQTGDTHANLIIRVEITAILLSCCSQHMRSRHPEPTHD